MVPSGQFRIVNATPFKQQCRMWEFTQGSNWVVCRLEIRVWSGEVWVIYWNNLPKYCPFHVLLTLWSLEHSTNGHHTQPALLSPDCWRPPAPRVIFFHVPFFDVLLNEKTWHALHGVTSIHLFEVFQVLVTEFSPTEQKKNNVYSLLGVHCLFLSAHS